MTKQEFLAMSLPYGLKYLYQHKTIESVIVQNKILIIDSIDFSSNVFQFWSHDKSFLEPLHLGLFAKGFRDDDIKCVLHPLSDLIKPITHKGETFVPAMLLSKMVAGIHNDDLDSEWIIKDNGRIICKTPWDLRIEIYYKTSEICFSVYNTWNQAEKRTIYQLSAFQKLISWHFDIAKLIEKGEAIDINTLKENPYE